jgi:hypothetical protein
VNAKWSNIALGAAVGGHTFGTDAFAAIQDGINMVAASGTVNVAAGTYFEHINVKNGIILQGAAAASTVIDGSNNGTVVSIFDASTIENFTIQNGHAYSGGGIYTEGAPTIKNNIIQDNHMPAGGAGSAIYGNGSSPIITGNLITGNTTDSQLLSGALSFSNASSPVITNNVICGNTGYGAIVLSLPTGNTPRVINNTIANNRGSGIVCSYFNSGTIIENNIIANNSQFGFYCGNGDAPQMSYNDIWNNTLGNYGGGVLTDQTGTNGNISTDPLFVNSGANDYHLQSHSPCIDAGTNSGAPPIDFDGNIRPVDGDGNGTAITDIGAYEYQPPVAAISISTPAVIGSSVDSNFTTQPVILVNDSFGHPVNGVVVTASCVAGTGTLRGTLTATTNATGLATFGNLGYNKSGEKFTLGFSVGPFTVDSAVLGPLSAGTGTRVIVETAANGSGTVVPAQNASSGSSITVYAVTRDQYGNFVANAAGTWSLTSITGGVVAGDLVPSGDTKSAVFTAHLTGTAVVQVTSGSLTNTPSGTITVISGGATKLSVSGYASPATAGTTGSITVTAQDSSGNTITTYAGTVHFTSTDSQASLPANYTFEITPVIASLKHDCKLKREMVKNNIGDLTGKTIIFKLVTLDKELVDVVTALLQHNIVIILINPEQKKVIDKNQYFQGLPCYHFPDPTLQFIIDLANFYNLGDFMSQRAILIAAILTKGNAKRFKDLIREAALTLQDGQTISESLIVKLGRTLITDIRNKVLVASLVSGSKVPAIIRKQVFVLFNEDITLKQISDILAERLAIEEASPGDILIGSEAIQEGTFQVISQPDISKSDRDLVNLVAKLSAQGDGVSLTELAKKTGRSKAGISGTVSRLIKLNYLKNLESSKGKSAQLVLGAVSLNK